MSSQEDPKAEGATEFETESEAKSPGLLNEYWDFLTHNKKWWLIPILLVLLLVGLLVVFGASSPVAPFIYSLF